MALETLILIEIKILLSVHECDDKGHNKGSSSCQKHCLSSHPDRWWWIMDLSYSSSPFTAILPLDWRILQETSQSICSNYPEIESSEYHRADVIQNYSADSLFLQKTIVGWLVNDSTTHYSVVMNLFLPFSHPVSPTGPAWVQITTQPIFCL